MRVLSALAFVAIAVGLLVLTGNPWALALAVIYALAMAVV
jgi:hypothetical protein